MTFVVAINADDQALAGIRVIEHTETPGLGGEAKDDSAFPVQFIGKSIAAPIKVSNDGGEINALTSATITTRAVCKGANLAVETYNKLKPQLTEKLNSFSK